MIASVLQEVFQWVKHMHKLINQDEGFPMADF